MTKRIRWLVFAILLTVLLTVTSPVSASTGSGAGATGDGQQPIASDVVLVGLEPGVSLNTNGLGIQSTDSALNATLADVGVQAVESVFASGQSTGILSTQDESPLNRIYRLRLSPGSEVPQAIDALSRNPAVAYAEPDYLAHVIATPNDPQYSEQWGLSQINASTAWDQTTGSSDVVIAVVDAGLDTSHPDLASQLWENPGEIADNDQDDDNNGCVDDMHGWNIVGDDANLSDSTGHGTQVAGVIAAETDNGEGIAGVCWNCRLMVVKVTQSGGVANYSDIAAGVAYAAQKGAEVINLSLGGYADSTTLRTAIEEAAETAVVIGGAGNDEKTDQFYPAAYDEVLAVAGTTDSDTKVATSNYGDWVDVSAPGETIRTTFGGGGYGDASGTSMAVPFVSGLAGLLKSQHADWSPELVQAHIVHTAVDIDGENPGYEGQLGSGRINANVAVGTDATPQLAVASYTVDGQDKAPEPGSTFELAVSLSNAWGPVSGLAGTLSTSDGYATVDDGSGTFGDIASGETGDNKADTFQVTLDSNTPYAHSIPFTLDLNGNDGFNTNLSFDVTVRSGFEHLPGGTVISTDTNWTADKTYVLDGNVVIGENVTLEIEPGTTIKGTPGNWLRVDGTLVASGTVDSPISFVGSINSITGTVPSWGGLRFSDKSEPTVLDENGGYVSGSIVRHAHLQHAETGIGINGSALSIADSVFESNYGGDGAGVKVSNNGQATIENCQFTDNGTGVRGNDSRLSVTDSTFTANSTAIYADNTSMTLIGNTITDNGTGVSGYGWGSNSVEARENVIMDNSNRGASLSGQVTFEHNLVANNGGKGLDLEINSSGNSQNNPDIAFNTQQNEYLVAWQEHRSDSNDILAQRVSGEGTVIGSEIAVATTISDEQNIQLAYNPTQNQYLAVYDQYDDMIAPDDNDVYARLLSGSGSPMGEPIPVSTAEHAQYAPHVVYLSAEDKYLVVWRDYRSSSSYELYGCLVENDGTLLSDELLLTNKSIQAEPALAYSPDDNRTLVTWYSSDWPEGIWGQWVTVSETQIITDTSFHIGESWDWGAPTVAYDDDHQQFLVAWQKNQNIYASVVPQTISSTVAVSSTSQLYAPHLSYNATTDQYWLTWRKGDMNPDIHARFLNYDGTVAGDILAVSAADNYQSNPIAAVNDLNGESLIAWQDSRSAQSLIYGQRLGSDGSLLDNPDTPEEETDPTVNFRIAPKRGVRYNTIINNEGHGMEVRGSYADNLSFGANNLFGNDTYDLYLGTSKNIDAGEGYWGDTPLGQIPVRIYDCNDKEFGCPDDDVGEVTYQIPAMNPITEAPAFVQDITVAPQTAGIEQATFDVTFSRPMDQGTPPTVTFHLSKRGTSTIFTEDDGLADNRVEIIEADQEGNLWFAFSDDWENGVNRYDGQAWTTYDTTNSGLMSNGVYDIFADSNGHIWFGHNEGISRWDGSNWITYTQQNIGEEWYDSIKSIDQASDGTMWFAVEWEGLLRYDGSSWDLLTTDDGLPGNSVRNLAVDQQDQVWIVFEGDTENGVAMYDGSSWTTYDESDGFTADWVRTVFVDSAGRVWVAGSSSTNTYLYKFEDNQWTSYGHDNTSGQLDSEIGAIAEDDDRVVWFACEWNNYFVKYDDGTWSRQETSGSSDETRTMAFDARGNLWTNQSYDGGARVLWLGDDYPVTDNAQWLDNAHHQATYGVTSLVPRGDYDVSVSGARSASTMMSGTQTISLPAGNMPIPNETRFGFTVDYAGEISDRTAPEAPSVIAGGKEGDPTTVEAMWWAEDPESEITGYRYAIGSAAGATDIVNWTDTSSESLTRSGLGLVEGQQYWIAVQASNAGGLWSPSGYSTFIAGKPFGKVFLPLIIRNN